MQSTVSGPTITSALLGTPYDRASTHCWWLATKIQAELFGRELPAGPAIDPGRHERARLIAGHEARARWRQVETPEDGDLVMMARMPGKDVHCGVFLDGRGVIHTDEPHGVVIDTVLELEQVRRWRITFYRPIEPS